MEINENAELQYQPSQKEVLDARKRNKAALTDLRLQHEYEKLMYEMNHYRLQSKLDFMRGEEIREEFLKMQDVAIARIEAQQTPPPSQIITP